MIKQLALIVILVIPCLAATKAEQASQLRNDLQFAWNTNAALTREYLLATMHDQQNSNLLEKTLLENQEAIGTLFEPLYGKEKAKKLTTLLTKLAQSTLDVIQARHKKDEPATVAARNSWKQHACELSTLLDLTNPYLQSKKLQDLFDTYFTKLSAMITDRQEKKWSDDLTDYAAFRMALHTIISTIGKAVTDAFPKPREQVAPPKPRVTVPLPPGMSLRSS